MNDSEIVGEGGYSTVYRGKDQQGKIYALKKISIQSEENNQICKQEIENLRRFSAHPNIIKLLGTLEILDGNMMPSMLLLFPFTEKGSIRDYLDQVLAGKQQPWTLLQVFLIFRQVVSAIIELHQVNLVHQDIKPGNVLLTVAPQGTQAPYSLAPLPLLIDFGSVGPAIRRVETRAQSMQIADQAQRLCSLPFRPPELFDPHTGSTLDSRTDVWSLGCLLYCIWFGYSPFEVSFSSSGLAQPSECSHSRVLSPVPRSRRSPWSGDEVVMSVSEWALERDINDRPTSLILLQKIDEEIQKLHPHKRTYASFSPLNPNNENQV